jgi:DedD protein
VKERLVGAAVLMAAAIILIPEMLSGPDGESPEQTADSGAGPIKTYTIDLSQAPGTSPPSVTTEGGDNRAPPPEEVALPSATPQPAEQAPQQQLQVSPEPSPQVSAEAPEERTPAPAARRDDPSPVVAETPPRQIAAQPARAEAPPQSAPKAEAPPPRPVASAPSAPTSAVPTASGWAVQLGSYSSEATAERLRGEWRAKGQNAFVMPVKSGGKTLYRVRIGPTKDRAGSEAALQAVKATIPGAAIVAHP